MKIGELSSQVNSLICVCREKNRKQTVSESSSSTDNIPNKDEKCIIISHSRSVDQILKWLENWVLVDCGMKCIACSHTINYNYQIEGRDFMTKSFQDHLET